MKLQLFISLIVYLFSVPIFAEENALFDIKSFCKMPIAEAKEKLPVDIKYFDIKEVENPHHGHREEWALWDKEQLKSLGLRILYISIRQDRVQQVFFKANDSSGNDEASLIRNLAKAGLDKNELQTVMGEYRVNPNRGRFQIRIMDNGSSYICFGS